MPSVAVLVVPLKDAVIVGVERVDTPEVVIVNVAVVEPDATVTDDGTCAATLLDAIATIVPPDPAGRARVTVPVTELPPTIDDVDKDKA